MFLAVLVTDSSTANMWTREPFPGKSVKQKSQKSLDQAQGAWKNPRVPTPPPRKTLADMLLGQPLEEWAAERKAEGLRWHVIARRLAELTDNKIDVSVSTLHQWIKEATEPERAAS